MSKRLELVEGMLRWVVVQAAVEEAPLLGNQAGSVQFSHVWRPTTPSARAIADLRHVEAVQVIQLRS